MDENIYICRCEDVTLADIKALVSKGVLTIDELKRLTRCGMGPCGGKTCTGILMAELAKAKNTTVSEVKPGKFRPPAKNVKLGTLAKAGEEE